MISRVSKGMVPVDNQQTALDFTSGPQPPAVRSGQTVTDLPPNFDLFFDCTDIEKTHAELSAAGYSSRPHVNTSAGGAVRMQRGNRYALGRWGGAEATAS